MRRSIGARRSALLTLRFSTVAGRGLAALESHPSLRQAGAGVPACLANTAVARWSSASWLAKSKNSSPTKVILEPSVRATMKLSHTSHMSRNTCAWLFPRAASTTSSTKVLMDHCSPRGGGGRHRLLGSDHGGLTQESLELGNGRARPSEYAPPQLARLQREREARAQDRSPPHVGGQGEPQHSHGVLEDCNAGHEEVVGNRLERLASA